MLPMAHAAAPMELCKVLRSFAESTTRSRRLKDRLRRRYSEFFTKKGRDPLYWIAIPLLIVLVLTAIGSAVLGRDLTGVQGGVWGFSALGTRVEIVLLQIPLLVWIMLLGLVPLLSRSMIATLASWFGLPLALWLGHTGLNLIQTVNVRFDREAARTVCAEVVRTRHLGCVPLVSKKGKSHRCGNVATLRGWPSPETTIDISGDYAGAGGVCFSGHRGFLALPWIDGVRAASPTVRDAS
jgi:hypothetical protein